MVQSVCSPGAWEPKPPARRVGGQGWQGCAGPGWQTNPAGTCATAHLRRRAHAPSLPVLPTQTLPDQECIRALGLLALPSCPLSGAVLLPPHAPRLLAYLKKQLQDADGSVRDAAAEALSCHAWALSDASGSPLPGSAAECPLLRVVMDCLCEQKKEGHLGASAALLMVRAWAVSPQAAQMRQKQPIAAAVAVAVAVAVAAAGSLARVGVGMVAASQHPTGAPVTSTRAARHAPRPPVLTPAKTPILALPRATCHRLHLTWAPWTSSTSRP